YGASTPPLRGGGIVCASSIHSHLHRPSLQIGERALMGGSILVVGSVAFDSVKTPFGEVDDILGGSATYFSVASSYFAPVRVVAVVGDDFEDRHIAVFRKHQIDIEGLKRAEG